MKNSWNISYLHFYIMLGIFNRALNLYTDKIHFSASLNETVPTPDTLILTGLFPIHNAVDAAGNCTQLNVERGFHRLEAMFYAVDRINNDPSILRNIKLKVNAIDTCNHAQRALDKTVGSIMKVKQLSCTDSNHLGVAAVIGGASSSVSLEIAKLLRLFYVPQISYASTSALLKDRTKYKYFFRTVSDDSDHVKAVQEIAQKFKWTSVHVIYSSDTYGESAYEAFKKLSLCSLMTFKVDDRTDFKEIIYSMQRYNSTRAVVLLCNGDLTLKLLNRVAELNVRQFVWISGDYWKTNFLSAGIQRVAKSAIIMRPRSIKIPQKFRDYFSNLKFPKNKRNLWFKEYWKKRCGNFTDDECIARKPPDEIKFDDNLMHVIDAVYAIALAIDQIYKEKCPEVMGDCLSPDFFDEMKKSMLEKLMSFTYDGVFGPTKFNAHGSAEHGFDVLQLQDYQYVNIGVWKVKEGLSLNAEKIWTPSESFCARPCKIGEVKRKRKYSPACCFDCEKCSDYQIVSGTQCSDCVASKGYMPSKERDRCVKLPLLHVKREWAVAVAVVAGVGVILTVAVSLIFFYYRRTEIVVASTPELTFPLLFGVFLCYSLTFFLIADQTEVIYCTVRRFGSGFSFCICYGALLTKTNRLDRIFSETSSSKRAPRFITASSQLVILLCIVVFQVLLFCIGVIIEKPAMEIRVNKQHTGMHKMCRMPIYDMASSYVYNFILIVVCAVYAFRTRKLPSCFNEAKYIGFVAYTTLVVWLTFVPVYTVGVEPENRTVALCVCFSINATSILFGLFAPKVYIILLRPQRNKRAFSSHSFSSHSTTADQNYVLPPVSTSMRKMTSTSLFEQIHRIGTPPKNQNERFFEQTQFYKK